MEVHFSNHYYLLLANLPTLKSKVAVASITVQTKNGPVSLEAMVDTGGAVSIASRHLLSNIKPAKKRGNPSCQMVTVNGLTPPYTHQGELHFTDEAGLPIVILCYAQHGPVLGHKDFVLIANSTVVAMKCDINYHAKASVSVGAVPLKRTSSEPYHYSDSIKRIQTKPKLAESQAPIDQQHTNATGECCMSSQTRTSAAGSRLPAHNGQETEGAAQRAPQPKEG